MLLLRENYLGSILRYRAWFKAINMDNITGLEKKVDNRVNVNFTEFKQVGITEEEGVKTAVFEGIANVMNAVARS